MPGPMTDADLATTYEKMLESIREEDGRPTSVTTATPRDGPPTTSAELPTIPLDLEGEEEISGATALANFCAWVETGEEDDGRSASVTTATPRDGPMATPFQQPTTTSAELTAMPIGLELEEPIYDATDLADLCDLLEKEEARRSTNVTTATPRDGPTTPPVQPVVTRPAERASKPRNTTPAQLVVTTPVENLQPKLRPIAPKPLQLLTAPDVLTTTPAQPKVNSQARPFPCDLCPHCSKTQAHLARHKNSAHSGGKRTEKCKVCGKCFKDTTGLRAHEKIHSALRPYLCRVCQKGFKTNETRRHHERRTKTCSAKINESRSSSQNDTPQN